MIKTGLYPSGDFRDSGSFFYVKSGDSWSRHSNVTTSDEAMTILRSVLNLGFETTDPGASSFWGAIGVSATGVPTPVHPDIVYNLDKIKTNNHPFQKRANDGDIVVSPYRIGSCKLTFSNGGNPELLGEEWGGLDFRGLIYNHGMFSSAEAIIWNGVFLTPNLIVAGAIAVRREKLSFGDDITPHSVGYTNTNYLKRYDSLEPTAFTVMECLAKANTASIDILTAMAELPETAKSIVDACKTMLRLYKDCRKGELRLHDKTKKIRLSYEQAVAEFPKLISQINSLNISKKEKKKRILLLSRQRKQLKSQFIKDIKDITDAIADVWLQFRYGIMPNVYLIQGALDVMENREKKFFRWTKLNKIDLSPIDPPPGWSVDLAEDIQERCFIKRRFDAGIRSGLSVNPFLTAWELVPLSFVVDWFIDIGTFAASQLTLLSSNGWQQEGSTFSWSVDATIKYVHNDSKASVLHHTKMYVRILIDPSLYCEFPWNPDLNRARYYDALALSWNLALKRLIK